MKNHRTRSSYFPFCIFHFAFFIVLFLCGCSTYWPTESRKFSPEFGVEGLLVDGRKIDSIWISLSYDILEAQPADQPVYDSAIVIISTDTYDDTLVSYDTLPNCFYSILDSTVKSGLTYHLYAKAWKEGVDTAEMTAMTTVPDSFSCVPMAPRWVTDTTIIDSVVDADNYKDIGIVDKQGNLLFDFINPDDILFYIYDDSLWIYTFLIIVFEDKPFGFDFTEFGIEPPVMPSASAKGIMIEYAWGDSGKPWEDLEFVMFKIPFGDGKQLDSTGYLEGTYTVVPYFTANTATDLQFIFTNFASVQYIGPSAFNFYAVDEAAYDYQATRMLDNPVSNVTGGLGVFGSASLYSIPFYLYGDRNIISNGDSKAIEEEWEARYD
jgi:hypothetical protein